MINLNFRKEILFYFLFKKCEEIKKYRLLQRQLIKSTDMAWENIILHFFDGSDAEAESSLHPFLG